MSIFAFHSYKQVLKEQINGRKLRDQHEVTFQGMAAHCRIQKTYLSKILNHSGHLSRDQLYLACEYLKLKSAEREFVLLLHELEDSHLPQRRLEIEKALETLRAKHIRTESYAKVRVIDTGSSDFSSYYLDPLQQIVHMFMTIPKYRRQPGLIAECLGIGDSRLTRYLDALEKLEIIKHGRGGYVILKDELHLPKESFLQPAYRTMLRLKAVEQLSKERAGSYSFSVVFSSNEKVRHSIQARFLEFLETAQQLVKATPEEEVYQMNFDLFGWS